jgi:hypothetical protein
VLITYSQAYNMRAISERIYARLMRVWVEQTKPCDGHKMLYVVHKKNGASKLVFTQSQPSNNALRAPRVFVVLGRGARAHTCVSVLDSAKLYEMQIDPTHTDACCTDAHPIKHLGIYAHSFRRPWRRTLCCLRTGYDRVFCERRICKHT